MAMGLAGTDERELTIEIGDVALPGDLRMPSGAPAIVLFAHGSGSSRKSPRNQLVARQLNEAGIATLLFDLLTEAEEQEEEWTGRLRFDIPFLAERLERATDFVRTHSDTHRLRIGYFGASTGAAAALVAAAERPDRVEAVVSRGGRPDLAEDALDRVAAPTLLIVGEEDHPVLEMNRAAFAALRCDKRLEVVPGATHLFEEPGKLEEVARLAREWFARWLVETQRPEGLLEPAEPRPASP